MNEEIKISELPEATNVAGVDIFPIVQDGVTKKATISSALINSNVRGFSYKGVWTPSIAYSVNDVVFYLGSSYIAKRNISATTDVPTIGDNWGYLSVKGDKGDVGPAGPQGVQGIPGPAGSQGEQGPAGPAGSQGPTGPQGPSGPQGSQGLTGPAGPQGLQGPAGPAGPAGGPQGPAGPSGPQGPAGPTGPQGPQGIQGQDGADGANGSDGYSPITTTTDVFTVPSGSVSAQLPVLFTVAFIPNSVILLTSGSNRNYFKIISKNDLELTVEALHLTGDQDAGYQYSNGSTLAVVGLPGVQGPQGAPGAGQFDLSAEHTFLAKQTFSSGALVSIEPVLNNEATSKLYVDRNISAIGWEVSSETSRALTAENQLMIEIATETQNRQTAISGAHSELSGAIVVVRGDLSQEVNHRINAIDAVMGNLNSEINDRIIAVNKVASDLNAEITNRTNAVNTVHTELTNETTRATNAESSLDTKIDNLNKELQKVSWEASAETARALKAESDLIGVVGQKFNSATGLIVSETTRSMSVESELRGLIKKNVHLNYEGDVSKVNGYNSFVDLAFLTSNIVPTKLSFTAKRAPDKVTNADGFGASWVDSDGNLLALNLLYIELRVAKRTTSGPLTFNVDRSNSSLYTKLYIDPYETMVYPVFENRDIHLQWSQGEYYSVGTTVAHNGGVFTLNYALDIGQNIVEPDLLPSKWQRNTDVELKADDVLIMHAYGPAKIYPSLLFPIIGIRDWDDGWSGIKLEIY